MTNIITRGGWVMGGWVGSLRAGSLMYSPSVNHFILMSKARFTVDIHPDLGPAVDLLVCKRAALFIGNLYSSFSFLLREAKLVAGETERTMYYNLDADETLGDLTREEALRWDVMPLGSPPGLMPAHTGARDEL